MTEPSHAPRRRPLVPLCAASAVSLAAAASYAAIGSAPRLGPVLVYVVGGFLLLLYGLLPGLAASTALLAGTAAGHVLLAVIGFHFPMFVVAGATTPLAVIHLFGEPRAAISTRAVVLGALLGVVCAMVITDPVLSPHI